MEFVDYIAGHRGDGHVEIRATVPKEDVARFVDEAIRSLAEASGFNPASPAELLRANLLADANRTSEDIDNIVKGYVVSRCAPFAVTALGEPIATEPVFYCEKTPSADEDLEIYVNVLKKPEAKLTSYDPVEVEIPLLEFTDEDIDAQVRELAENKATFTKAEWRQEPMMLGDFTHIDLTISKNGKPIPQFSKSVNLFCADYGSMPAAFVDRVLGMVPGEFRSFDFEGPREGSNIPGQTEAYHADVKFLCHMDRHLPDITDEWFAANYPQYKSLGAFREDMRERLAEQVSRKERELLGDAVDYAVLERLQCSVPDEVYEFAMESMSASFVSSLKSMNITRDEFFERNNTTEEDYTTQMMLEARRSLRQGFALDALFEGRHMQLTDDDVDAFLETMAPGNAQRLRQEMEETGRMYVVFDEARRAKAHQWLVDTALCTRVKAD